MEQLSSAVPFVLAALVAIKSDEVRNQYFEERHDDTSSVELLVWPLQCLVSMGKCASIKTWH